MKRGSFIAVLADQTHRTGSGVFPSVGYFHEFVRDELREVRYRVEKFVFAIGTEMQEYTPREVLEVYFGE
jgi:hypothetical protein